MIRALVLVIALALPGCAALASKEATVACQVADAASTYYALSSGAREVNPLWASVIDRLGWGGFFFLKAAVTVALLHYHDRLPQGARATLNVATCLVALNNVAVGRRMSHLTEESWSK